jgi:hypothetical protein
VCSARSPQPVMPGLVPGIHVLSLRRLTKKTWLAGTSASGSDAVLDGYARP